MLYKMVGRLPVVARINQGPLMLEGHGDKELATHLAIRKRFRFRCALMISPAVSRTDDSAIALKGIGFRRIGKFNWASSRVDLTRADGDLRKALDAKWRNQLNKAEKNGLLFIADNDVQWILQTHIRNMAEKGFEGPAPSLLRALHETSPADFLVFKAVHEGAPVAGMVAYRFGDVAHYYIGWFGPEGRKISAGNFLLWNAALELKRLGVRQFDLGGHNNKFGFGGFKMGMNGVGYQCAGEFLSL
jgi:hypothetical protein